MEQHTVKIPSDFFLKECRQEYSGSLTKRLLQEFLQNSLDAGASRIFFVYEDNTLVIRDNGIGMDEETCKEGLLTFGGSIKGEGATGGFGKAKFLILYAQESYRIKSRTVSVAGNSIYYSLTQADDSLKGTMIIIKFPQDWPWNKAEELTEEYKTKQIQEQLEYIVKHSNVNAEIFFNGDLVEQAVPQALAMETLTGKIYPHKEKQLIVRVNGLYMFEQGTFTKGYYYDITGHSREVLSQNREAFRKDNDGEVTPFYKDFWKFHSMLNQNSMSGVSAYSETRRTKETNKTIDGIPYQGDNLPNKMAKRHRMIFSLCTVVARMLGKRDFNKDYFGFLLLNDFMGMSMYGRIWMNPNKFDEKDWIIPCVETFLHEWVHASFGRDISEHNESFISEYGQLMVKFLKEYSGINPLLAEARKVEKEFFGE